jgi:hypothetical protein
MFSVESVPRTYNENFQGSTELLAEGERVQLKNSSFEGDVKNWVEFWRWQLKVIEKKWQERN